MHVALVEYAKCASGLEGEGYEHGFEQQAPAYTVREPLWELMSTHFFVSCNNDVIEASCEGLM